MRRRILLLVTDLEIGGTPTVVRELALRLRERADLEVASLKTIGPVGDELRAKGVQVEAFGATGAAQLPRVAVELRRLVRRRQFDTVFSFLVHANAVAAIASVGLRRVRFVQSIQTAQREPGWHWTVGAIAARFAERIIVPSSSAAEAARKWSRVPPAKIDVISNAVDVEVLQGVQRVRSDGPFRVGFIGRLDPVKNIGLLLKAVALSRRAGADVTLDIFGDGGERSRTETCVRRLGIEKHVTLHGTVAGPAEALRRIDCLVLPSHAEGFGLVLIEAMAAGVPVIGTDVPGIRDVIRHGETGLLVRHTSATELSGAITRVKDDAALRDRLIAAAREDVLKRFSWPAVLQQYRAVLRI